MPPVVATVTAALMASVRVSVCPAVRSAVLGDAVTEDTVGGVVLRVTISGLEGAEVLPAASVARAVSALAPAASAVVAVIDQAPVPSAVPVPIWVAPSNK